VLEDHLKSPAACRRLRAGPAGPHVDSFTDWMQREGYRPSSINGLCGLLGTWTNWMARTKAGTDLLAGLDSYQEMLRLEGRLHNTWGKPHKAVSAASVFVRFLQMTGALPKPEGRSAVDTWPILLEFRGWEKRQHGLTDSSIKLYEGVLVHLLAAVGTDARTYTAEDLRAFVLEHARPHGRHRAATIVTSVRTFLRFLGATGRCRPGLQHAIPAFASFKQSSVPRYLVDDDIQRVIDVCVGQDATGLRERAVILLLARLGLRGSDVERLALTDVDWREGRIAACGKTRRQCWLPLPQDVGDAIAAYLRGGRPQVKLPQVFLTLYAPFRHLGPGSTGNIARGALRRAGVQAPTSGTHVFRHSAATSMLRQGVSLAGIGAVLRHRSPDTTMQYAKVDFGSLAGIAQPWPQES
jgi:integrase/recombinase XerD